MKRAASLLCLLIASAVCLGEEVAPIAVGKVTIEGPLAFDRHVFPILREKCVTCHDHEGGLAEGELDLTTVAALAKGGKHGPGIETGKGEASLVFQRASHQLEPIMPPKDEGDPLTPDELALLKTWIDQGAAVGENANPAGERSGPMLGEIPPGVHPAYALDLSPDGRWLAIGRANQVVIQDVATGEIVTSLAGHQDLVHSIAISPDGRWIAAGSFEIVKLWQKDDSTEGGTAWKQVADIESIKERALALAFSPDGTMLAIGSGVPSASGEIALCRIADQSEVHRIGEAHSDTVLGLAFSPDGTRIASASADKFLKIHHVDSGALDKSFEGHTGQVLAVSWSSDGKMLATASADRAIKIWSDETGEHVRTITPDRTEVTAVRFLPGLKTLVSTGGDRLVRRINAEDGNIIRNMEGAQSYLLSMDVSDDGKLVLAGGQNGDVYLFDLGEGKLTRTLPAPQSPAVSSNP